MFRNLKTAAFALALAAGPGFAGAAFAQDQTPTGHMESEHMSHSATGSDHMSSGAMASDHMASDATHANKMRHSSKTPDAMSSDGTSNAQH